MPNLALVGDGRANACLKQHFVQRGVAIQILKHLEAVLWIEDWLCGAGQSGEQTMESGGKRNLSHSNLSCIVAPVLRTSAVSLNCFVSLGCS